MPIVTEYRKELFAQAYVRGEHAGNGTASYRAAVANCTRASAARGANRLLKDTSVLRRIAELQAEMTAIHADATRIAIDRLAITKETVLRELAKIAFANMRHYAPVLAGGDLSGIDEDMCAAIQEIVVDTTTVGTGKSAKVTKRARIKLADKRGALDDLGKHLGLFVEQRHVTHEFADMSYEQLARYIRNVATELAQYGIDVAALVGVGGGTEGDVPPVPTYDAAALPAVPEAAAIPHGRTDVQ